MSNIDDKLNEVLNIAEEVLEKKEEKNPLEVANEKPTVVIPQADVDTDFDKGRGELYKLLEKGNEAIDGILALAKEGEHPRAYEVAGQLIKTVSDTAEKLIDLQKKLKDIEGESQVKTQHNHLYVGSTSELQKFLKKSKKNETEET